MGCVAIIPGQDPQEGTSKGRESCLRSLVGGCEVAVCEQTLEGADFPWGMLKLGRCKARGEVGVTQKDTPKV